MTLCVQMLFFKRLFRFYFFKEEVKLCDVKVDCKSIRLLTGQPKILKKVVRACIVCHCWRVGSILL